MWSGTEPFARTGHPLLAIDLRRAPAGPVRDWLRAPHEMREFGCCVVRPQGYPQVLSPGFDALIYVDRTTRARPLPGGLRPHRLDE